MTLTSFDNIFQRYDDALSAINYGLCCMYAHLMYLIIPDNNY